VIGVMPPVIRGGRASKNREVSRLSLLAVRGDPSAMRGEAYPEEGGSWGKHGCPHGSEAERSDERGVFA
jgi:hypothetical protein